MGIGVRGRIHPVGQAGSARSATAPSPNRAADIDCICEPGTLAVALFAPSPEAARMPLKSNSESPAAPAVPTPAALPQSHLAMQSQEIIDCILADPDPGLAEVKQRLAQCVANYDGVPERALLVHVIETRRRSNSST